MKSKVTELRETINELLDVLIDGLNRTTRSMVFAPETWRKTYSKEINIVEKVTGEKIEKILKDHENE